MIERPHPRRSYAMNRKPAAVNAGSAARFASAGSPATTRQSTWRESRGRSPSAKADQRNSRTRARLASTATPMPIAATAHRMAKMVPSARLIEYDNAPHGLAATHGERLTPESPSPSTKGARIIVRGDADAALPHAEKR